MPTSANWNFYRGSEACVRWHSDNEGLFGGRWDSKLIVSMSFGFSALFEWKPRPSPDSDAHSYWLHHGDLLVMDGCCQDEYPSLYGPLVEGRASEYHLPVDQEPSLPVPFGCWGDVLSAHVCKGFIRFYQRGM